MGENKEKSLDGYTSDEIIWKMMEPMDKRWQKLQKQDKASVFYLIFILIFFGWMYFMLVI